MTHFLVSGQRYRATLDATHVQRWCPATRSWQTTRHMLPTIAAKRLLKL